MTEPNPLQDNLKSVFLHLDWLTNKTIILFQTKKTFCLLQFTMMWGFIMIWNNLLILSVWRKIFYTCNQCNVFKYSIMELMKQIFNGSHSIFPEVYWIKRNLKKAGGHSVGNIGIIMKIIRNLLRNYLKYSLFHDPESTKYPCHWLVAIVYVFQSNSLLR